jgi:tetratricopeptide (TPR) repeat protein
VIEVNPQNADAYYSTAVVNNELHTCKSALRDYDAALEISPTFGSALLNCGSVRDDNGDYAGAIEDYDKAIGLSDDDEVTKTRAYFNRRNTKLHLKDKSGACADWNIALRRLDQPRSRKSEARIKRKSLSSSLAQFEIGFRSHS